MTITYNNGATEAASSATSADITHGLTINEDELMLLYIHVNSYTVNVTTPSGWTRIYHEGMPRNSALVAVYYKIAGASEGDTFTAALDETAHYRAVLKVFASSLNTFYLGPVVSDLEQTSNVDIYCNAQDNMRMPTGSSVSVLFGSKDNRGISYPYYTEGGYDDTVGDPSIQVTGVTHQIYSSANTLAELIRIMNGSIGDDSHSLALIIYETDPSTAGYAQIVGHRYGYGASGSSTVPIVSTAEAGDLLVLIMGCRAGALPATISGWTNFADAGGGASDEVDHIAYWRKSDGSDGDSVTVTTGGWWSSNCLRITGAADPTVTPPEGAAWSGGNTAETTPDPPSLTASFGASKNLWLATWTHRWDGRTTVWPTGFDAGYPFRVDKRGESNNSMGICAKESENATENPSAFTTSKSSQPAALTLVIPPLAAANLVLPLIMQQM